MKKRGILLALLLIAVVIFSVSMIAAKGGSEKDYIGTWKNVEDDEDVIQVLTCHTGDCYIDKTYYSFTWTVEDGYLIIHRYASTQGIRTYLTSDGGKTMQNIKYDGTGYVFKKVS